MSSLFTTYLPSSSEITAAALADARARVEAIWRAYDASADTTPGSVVGDRILTPFAGMIAAVEEASRRLMSDMDPQNVANGVIYSCDFVTRFLDNFGVYAADEQLGGGVLRLSFDQQALDWTDNKYELDRSLRFRTVDGVELEMVLTYPGGLILRTPGALPQENTNQAWLVEIGPDRFSVDIQVMARVPVTVAAGAAMSVSETITGLTACNALVSFHSLGASGLSTLAKKVRETAYAATPSQLGGLRRFIKQAVPRATLVSASGPGDPGMLRGSANALGLPVNAIDVRVRGYDAWQLDRQTVWLEYDTDNDRFVGEWQPMQAPLLLRGVSWTTSPQIQLDATIWGRSGDTRAPLLTAAGSGLEEYWISLPMPLDDADAPLISLSVLRGNPGAWFTVDYLCDPTVAAVRAALLAPDNLPIGADVLVKPLLPVELNLIRANYRRRNGVTFNLAAARSEIHSHVLGTGWPEIMSDAAWIDSINYAGASSVIGFDVEGAVRWSVAHRWLPDDADSPVEDYDAALAASFTPPVVEVTSTQELIPTYIDPDWGLGTATGAACGPKDLHWYIEASSVRFREYA